ncbi:hypothetical protein AAW51_1336 [Caldimonas brevitalea]|uniref:Uncharacterized protein n=1 Tax=Caldimonas brevitalea TaxID=413882 RepID=A0A0G3BFC7_9BURK|nr:hypothetical protein AAW51_1336 [Caldimonas brevitalea]
MPAARACVRGSACITDRNFLFAVQQRVDGGRLMNSYESTDWSISVPISPFRCRCADGPDHVIRVLALLGLLHLRNRFAFTVQLLNAKPPSGRCPMVAEGHSVAIFSIATDGQPVTAFDPHPSR